MPFPKIPVLHRLFLHIWPTAHCVLLLFVSQPISRNKSKNLVLNVPLPKHAIHVSISAFCPIFFVCTYFYFKWKYVQWTLYSQFTYENIHYHIGESCNICVASGRDNCSPVAPVKEVIILWEIECPTQLLFNR